MDAAPSAPAAVSPRQQQPELSNGRGAIRREPPTVEHQDLGDAGLIGQPHQRRVGEVDRSVGVPCSRRAAARRPRPESGQVNVGFDEELGERRGILVRWPRPPSEPGNGQTLNAARIGPRSFEAVDRTAKSSGRARTMLLRTVAASPCPQPSRSSFSIAPGRPARRALGVHGRSGAALVRNGALTASLAVGAVFTMLLMLIYVPGANVLVREADHRKREAAKRLWRAGIEPDEADDNPIERIDAMLKQHGFDGPETQQFARFAQLFAPLLIAPLAEIVGLLE